MSASRFSLLSILIPCYNEEATIERTVQAVVAQRERFAALGLELEIVVVDDASRDGTFERVQRCTADGTRGLVMARHPKNRGKGAAIRTAREHATGDIAIIQDADLEYDPREIPAMITPILDGQADAVVGTRFGGGGAHRVLYFWHRVGNQGLTLLSNMFTNLNLTDMEVGYKAFTMAAFRCMHLTNDRFGVEPEMVARLSQMEARVYEVPISYYGRTYAEGKKITWRDGAAALNHIVLAHLSSRTQPSLASTQTTHERGTPSTA